MEVLVTGCERSGTKMLTQSIEEELGVEFQLENKHTIASYKYAEELLRWEKYKNDPALIGNVYDFEKHSLNIEININFLKWVKKTWSNVKIYYIIRDGRNVVSSIINKTWGHSQTQGKYKINLKEACNQWVEVIDKTWDWAKANCEIIRYEDLSDIISNPLTINEKSLVEDQIGYALNKVGY